MQLVSPFHDTTIYYGLLAVFSYNCLPPRVNKKLSLQD